MRLEERLLHVIALSTEALAADLGKEEGPAKRLAWSKGDCLRVVRAGAGPGARRDMNADDERMDVGGRSWLSSSS